MRINTSRFGEIDIQDEKILYFPLGLIGFENYKRYVLIDHQEESPFKWLQSVEDPCLAFLIMDPFYFKPDYEFELTEKDEKDLKLTKEEKSVIVFVTVAIPKDRPQEMTTNLLGPLVINAKEKLGKQVVLTKDEYEVKHKILEEIGNNYACSQA